MNRERRLDLRAPYSKPEGNHQNDQVQSLKDVVISF